MKIQFKLLIGKKNFKPKLQNVMPTDKSLQSEVSKFEHHCFYFYLNFYSSVAVERRIRVSRRTTDAVLGDDAGKSNEFIINNV